ncbi:IS66 family insertion sequence element accessory protein TnpA [Lachnospiraceae bacterium YH-ros2228]
MSSRAQIMPEEKRIELINECRRSGLSDAEWCRQNGIKPSTFYMWVKRCRETCAGKKLIPRNPGGMPASPISQEVVPVSIVPEEISVEHSSSVPALQVPEEMHLDNSHQIEILTDGITIRIRNDASSYAISRVFRHLKEIKC